MIKKLDHTNLAIATKMHAVFQVSYAVEAKLLNAVNFPPLQRPLESYIKSKSTFCGYHIKEEIVGIIEVSPKEKNNTLNPILEK